MDLDESYEAFSVWECKEGEEHVPRLLLNEAVKGEAVDLNLATDMSRGIYSCTISYCLPEFYFKRFYILPEFRNINYLMSQYFSINNPSFFPFRGIHRFLQEFTLFIQSIILPYFPRHCLIYIGYHNLP